MKYIEQLIVNIRKLKVKIYRMIILDRILYITNN